MARAVRASAGKDGAADSQAQEDKFYRAMSQNITKRRLEQDDPYAGRTLPKLTGLVTGMAIEVLRKPNGSQELFDSLIRGVNRAISETLFEGAGGAREFAIQLWSRSANDVAAEFMKGKLKVDPAALLDALKRNFSESEDFLRELDGLRTLMAMKGAVPQEKDLKKYRRR